MYNAIDGDSIFDAMFVNSYDVGFNDDDAKPSSAARQKVLVCAGGCLVCILIFGCNKWGLTKEHIFTRFCRLKFRERGGDSLFCIPVVSFSHGRLVSITKYECAILSVHGGPAAMYRLEH